MNLVAVTAANTVQLSRLCPIPHAWAAYFLDSNGLFDAWMMGCALQATLVTADDRDKALPLVNWLQATCVKIGLGAGDRWFSALDMTCSPGCTSGPVGFIPPLSV
jgi:hypothetical protein